MLKKLLPWLIFSLFGFYLVGTNFSAKLGMIDDHEIAMFLGEDGEVRPSEFAGVVTNTELGQWGTNTRFRPSYYTLRVLETMVWKDNATVWYVCRYLILVLSMILAWEILIIYLPSIVAYLFIFYVMTMPFWPDILTRLGPSEIYALPAVLLFFYGLIKNKLWTWILGYVIAVGAKENLLILLPILCGHVIMKRQELTKRDWWAFFVAVIYTTWIVGGIVLATSRVGVDFYLNEISYGKRLKTTITSLPEIIDNRHLLLPLIMFAVLAAVSPKNYLVLGTTILLAALSQYVFYNNKLPSNTRYDFPALLLFPIFDLVVIKMLIEASKKYVYGNYGRVLIYTGLSLVMLAFVGRRGYTLIHQSAGSNLVNTKRFDDNLSKVQAMAIAHPDATLVFSSIHFVDFEPMISTSRYLTAKRIKNKIVINNIPEIGLMDPLGKNLEQRMLASMNGEPSASQDFGRFSPKREITTPCYTVSFYLAPEHPGCPTIANF